DVQPGDAGPKPGDVVRVMGADADAHQPATGCRDDLQLLASVAGGEPHRPFRGRAGSRETEVGVVRRRLLDIRDTHGDRGQPMQAHCVTPRGADPGRGWSVHRYDSIISKLSSRKSRGADGCKESW